MLRDNLVGLIEPMLHSARPTPLALRVLRTALPATPTRHRTIDPECLENPRPEGAEPSIAENVASPFHAEPRQCLAVKKVICKQGPEECESYWGSRRSVYETRTTPITLALRVDE